MVCRRKLKKGTHLWAGWVFPANKVMQSFFTTTPRYTSYQLRCEKGDVCLKAEGTRLPPLVCHRRFPQRGWTKHQYLCSYKPAVRSNMAKQNGVYLAVIDALKVGQHHQPAVLLGKQKR
ncbi:hypothetical protein GGTG_06923 [Gaeumannomyces tritici R3-111a-1]|uniref:Uncharacterized protein n=1 Tax=Gaeumannomyces tritici (strain R3-111a-1) TaxID=644352 RepID=J3P076_GAET3|nr:hypothetical protein GGTG_06923 [Gaeumannomyces tritici R3-111a-1]EJT77009.1 hypothetical protein GGTG_06923 [Gaeumannomyces tritici R3-111a-1]